MWWELLDSKVDKGTLSEDEVEATIEIITELWSLLRTKDSKSY